MRTAQNYLLDCRPDSQGGTRPVGSYPPNDFGLYDMAGNVWEMLADCYTEDYSAHPRDGSGSGGECGDYVRRGGGWGSCAEDLRSTLRDSVPPGFAWEEYGFRVAMDPVE